MTHSPRSRRLRGAAAALSIALVIALAIVAFVSCSSGSSKPQATISPSTTPLVIGKARPLTIGHVHIETVGATINLSKKVRNAVLASAQRYVDTGVYTPLERGAVGPGYAALFEPGLRVAATTTDRAALTELPIGKATKYVAGVQPLAVSGLVDGSGALLYLSTNFTLHEKITRASGPLVVTRDVELTFAPSGKQWRVAAYRVVTTRKTPVATTTTTARSRPGTTP